jgi:hypothetical protein
MTQVSIKDKSLLSQYASNRLFVLFFLGISILAGAGIGFLVVYSSDLFAFWLLLGVISALRTPIPLTY